MAIGLKAAQYRDENTEFRMGLNRKIVSQRASSGFKEFLGGVKIVLEGWVFSFISKNTPIFFGVKFAKFGA